MRLLGVRARAMRGTRWKRPKDPGNTGPEVDASFYVGRNAEHRHSARHRGGAATEAFEAMTPLDFTAGGRFEELEQLLAAALVHGNMSVPGSAWSTVP